MKPDELDYEDLYTQVLHEIERITLAGGTVSDKESGFKANTISELLALARFYEAHLPKSSPAPSLKKRITSEDIPHG